jgi:hypothetical protein
MKNIVNFIRRALSFLFRSILVILLLMMMTPPGYFFWRANRPMESPEFHGLTYYTYLNERRLVYAYLAQEYKEKHPDQNVDYRNCLLPEVAVQFFLALPIAGFFTLTGFYPGLERYLNPMDIQQGYVPDIVSWSSFLPDWWRTFEQLVLGMAIHARVGPVPYCRVSKN